MKTDLAATSAAISKIDGYESILGADAAAIIREIKLEAKEILEQNAALPDAEREAFRAEAARIVDKHASRKDPRFVNDRALDSTAQFMKMVLGNRELL